MRPLFCAFLIKPIMIKPTHNETSVYMYYAAFRARIAPSAPLFSRVCLLLVGQLKIFEAPQVFPILADTGQHFFDILF